MTPPGAGCQSVKFLPIAFLPSGHSEKNLRFVICCVHPSFGSVLFIFTSRSQHWMLNFYKRFVKWHTAKPWQRTENARLRQAQPYCGTLRLTLKLPAQCFQHVNKAKVSVRSEERRVGKECRS